MADDSIEIVEDFDFHPCNTPRGMLYYDMNVLTAVQQQKLNSLKRKVVREDEEYLADHPEVRIYKNLIFNTFSTGFFLGTSNSVVDTPISFQIPTQNRPTRICCSVFY